MKSFDDRDKQEAMSTVIKSNSQMNNNLLPKYREITEQEWQEYEWIEVREFGGDKIFIRGVKRTQPPNDSYHYEDVTKMGDKEQKWERAKTIAWTLV